MSGDPSNPATIFDMASENGMPTGTRFAHWKDDNTVVITTRDSRGTHTVELSGHEALHLRGFLNGALTKRRTK